jgi:thiol-disulfide isomerase/thioredoxin
MAVVAVTALLFVGRHIVHKNSGSSSQIDKANGSPAPEFELSDLDGKPVKLSDFRGHAVLLNFWATWCSPCKVEMPWFVELQKQYGPQGLSVVGVAMDDASKDDIAKFTKDMGVNYPILLGKEAVGEAYGGVQFLPTTFYIDRNGRVVERVFGLTGKGEIEDNIKKALAGASVPTQHAQVNAQNKTAK